MYEEKTKQPLQNKIETMENSEKTSLPLKNEDAFLRLDIF